MMRKSAAKGVEDKNFDIAADKKSLQSIYINIIYIFLLPLCSSHGTSNKKIQRLISIIVIASIEWNWIGFLHRM